MCGEKCSHHRRRSANFATDNFTKKLRSTLEDLHEIWDVAGLDEMSRGDRVQTFYDHLGCLLDDMLSSENTMLQELKEKLERYRTDLKTICEELEIIPAETLVDQKMELIDLVETYRQEFKRLNLIKSNRLERLYELTPKDRHLSDRLGRAPFMIFNSVPTEMKLSDLQDHIQRSEQLLATRIEDYQDAKTEIIRICKRMGIRPDEKIPHDKDESTIIFSLQFAENVQEILEQIRREYDEYLKQFKSRFDSAKQELMVWQQKCMQNDNDCPIPTFDEDSISEDVIKSIGVSIERLKVYYSEREALLAKIEEWNSIWKEKVDHDRREQDPQRYQNRGGNLQKELNRRRHVERVLLPKAKAAISEASINWERLHPTRPVLIRNFNPVRYIDQIICEYEEDKQ